MTVWRTLWRVVLWANRRLGSSATGSEAAYDRSNNHRVQVQYSQYPVICFLARGRTRTHYSIQLFADDRVARGHLIGQILQMWRRSQQQPSNLDS